MEACKFIERENTSFKNSLLLYFTKLNILQSKHKVNIMIVITILPQV